ncbi:MAG: ABC transporter ATP-binding protein [Minwuia sp.]|uniref:ABC transporter ATP-binding protein n=1 Tax=Minwuia sp. TaxID=2493630 RepID=UPI003A8872C9
MAARRIELRGLVKRFGALIANDNVDLTIEPGACLALLGENGAGKSTLMKILYGFQPPDAGEIRIDGEPVRFQSPADAMAAGIGMVFQNFSLVPALTVRENLLLTSPGAPWLQTGRSAAERKLLDVMQRLAPDIDPGRRVADLAVGERQLVELAKVLNLDADTIILDEPTSVLTPSETERLYGFVRTLRSEGRAVVLITHKLADVEACADRIAIMRRGRLIHDGPSDGVGQGDMVRMMVGDGAPAGAEAPPLPSGRTPKVIVKDLSAEAETGGVRDISLEVAAGELLGVAGVVGNGQTVLADALVGLHPLSAGDVTVGGVSFAWKSRPPRPDGTIAYVPERPLDNGVVPQLGLADNLDVRSAATRSFWQFGRDGARQAARSRLEDADVRPPEPYRQARTLSGGNLQKLVLGRELAGRPELIVACYPTMGLDVAASRTVYRRLFAHLERGAAIIWISEELDDLLAYAHRIAVLHGGRIAGIRDRDAADRNEIGELMLRGTRARCA